MRLRSHAETIWQAGVKAVDSAETVRSQISCDGKTLTIAGVALDLCQISRIEIVGAGKAGAGMAAGAETALLSHAQPSQISGWVNVPADCLRPLRQIHLHAARPACLNEPTQIGVQGTEEILQRVSRLTHQDVCLVLLSGGASALLCCPASGISLEDKLIVTRALASDGAPIHELNLVRTQLSRVKGGRLAQACKAGTLIALIISDVIGDPLDIVGSGPTVVVPQRAEQAIEILKKRNLLRSIPKRVLDFLRSDCGEPPLPAAPPARIVNRIVASNEIAMRAAAEKARQLGYLVESLGSANAGEAAAEGRRLLQLIQSAKQSQLADHGQPRCLLSGGEPTVNLGSSVTSRRAEIASPGKGGRNQELVLATIAAAPRPENWSGIFLLSGGTDGEDGPTDAAGAFADAEIVGAMAAQAISPNDFLDRHDSYHFFTEVNGLFRTGPTHTNVMDLRVALCDITWR